MEGIPLFVPTFQIEDFPRMEQEKAGYCIYRGVLIKWDEDYDRRIFSILDKMPVSVRTTLVIIQEHENCLSLIWQNEVPENYKTGKKITLNNGDRFLIYDSRTIGTKPLDYWKQFPTEEESWQT